MLRFQVTPISSKFLNLKHEIVKQPVRTWRTIVQEEDRVLDVREKIKSDVSPPAGASNYVYNRNPRNLERLAIANKGHGWTLEKPGRTFWHKLIVSESRLGVKVSCVHQNGKVVMSASSDEWCIRQYLPKRSDKCAYKNVGRVFAQRCLQSGLMEMFSKYKFVSDGKLALLIKAVEDGGVTLNEPRQMLKENPKTKVKPLRPWNVIVE